jgi:hypothetical protein
MSAKPAAGSEIPANPACPRPINDRIIRTNFLNKSIFICNEKHAQSTHAPIETRDAGQRQKTLGVPK